jgi:acetyltransferase-like isoleucine patch superfamily enzyme
MKIQYKGYSFFSIIYLFICLTFTRIFFRNSKLIRIPVFIRYKSNIFFGRRLTTGKGCRLDAFPTKSGEFSLIFGDDCQINDYVHIGALIRVKLGNNVLIASRVFITDHNHGVYSGSCQSSPYTAPSSRKVVGSEVEIEDNVWIGEGACILPGVKIGKGSIIASNSVVTKSIPSNSIAAGVPAKVIKVFSIKENKWIKSN